MEKCNEQCTLIYLGEGKYPQCQEPKDHEGDHIDGKYNWTSPVDGYWAKVIAK